MRSLRVSVSQLISLPNYENIRVECDVGIEGLDTQEEFDEKMAAAWIRAKYEVSQQAKKIRSKVTP